MRTHVAGFAVAAGLLAASVRAQPVLPTGSRARLWLRDTTTLPLSHDRVVSRSGVVAVVDGQVILIRLDDGETHRVPLSAVVRADSSTGRSSRRLAGAVFGGVLTGAAFVGSSCWFSDGSCAVNGSNVSGFLVYYAVGAIPGVFIGRAIGGRIQGPERWQTVWTR